MKSYVIGALAALFCSVSFATHTPPPVEPPVAPPPTATASAEQGQGQQQGQAQGQLQGQGQGQGQQQVAVSEGSTATSGSVAGAHAGANSSSGPSSASSGGNTLSTTYKQVKQAVAASASAGNATSACVKDLRAGLGSVFGGISIGGSKADKDCRLEQAADKELARGNVVASVRLRCKISFYADTLGEDCMALLEQAPTQSPEYVTRDEMRNALKAKAGVANASK